MAEKYPVRLACTACRWIDVSYTAGHHRSHAKLGHKVNREPNGPRCSGSVVVVTDDPDYPKGTLHSPAFDADVAPVFKKGKT